MEKNHPYKNQTVAAGRRTYFLDLEQTRRGSQYLKIVESVRQPDGRYKRHQVIIFEEHLNRVFHSLLQVFPYFNAAHQLVLPFRPRRRPHSSARLKKLSLYENHI